MRMKVLVLSALLLLAFLARNAYSVNWDNPESQTVDQMFAGDRGAPLNGEYASPQASRAAQSGQENKAILNLPVGSTLSSGATSPQQARSDETNQVNPTQPVVTKTIEPVQPTISPDTTSSMTGRWSLKLNDNASRNAALTLFQSGEAVYGTGNINLDPTTVAMAIASGIIKNDKLSLDVVSLGQVSLYRIYMTLSGDSASGSYTTYSPGSSSPVNGTATLIRSGT
jgi:hypothetical protein